MQSRFNPQQFPDHIGLFMLTVNILLSYRLIYLLDEIDRALERTQPKKEKPFSNKTVKGNTPDIFNGNT